MTPALYCSGAALPFRDSSVDGAMAMSVLEHVSDPPAILREVFRALRPGGRLLLVTPFCFPFHGEPNDFRRWTVEGLAAEARGCGFELEKACPIGSSFSSLVLNLHVTVRYDWRESRSLALRAFSILGWPLALPWQAATNGLALLLDHLDTRPRLPLGVAIVARRP